MSTQPQAFYDGGISWVDRLLVIDSEFEAGHHHDQSIPKLVMVRPLTRRVDDAMQLP